MENNLMKSLVRYALFGVSVVQLIAALGFFFQWPLATALWPFAGTTPLTYIFVASIFAAAAASTSWAVVTKNYGALAGIALDYVFILVPVSIFMFLAGLRTGEGRLLAYGLVCAFAVVAGVGLLAWSLSQAQDRLPPMPGVARWSFIVFILALVIVSTRLIVKAPNTLPWTITPDLSVVIGWMFFGAAAYFAYGLLRPNWANTAGPLAGFLAYDAVLIVPFLTRLPSVAPEHRLGLYIYTAVVTYSGLLAVYYLFVKKATRVWGKQPA
jgi:hypothetical protein